MNCKLIGLSITLMMLSSIIPALGFSTICSFGDERGSAGASGIYVLDDSVQLNEGTVLSNGGIYRTSLASGAGSNIITQNVAGAGYSVESSMGSTGALLAASLVSASAAGAGISQSAQASGDADVTLTALEGQRSSLQGAGVDDGTLSTAQSISAGGGILSAQSTSIDGQYGTIASGSSTEENSMSVDGDFSGKSSLSADLVSAAYQRAYAGGSASVAGIDALRQEDLSSAAYGDSLVSLDGVYMQSGSSLGSFGVRIYNSESSSTDSNVASGTRLPLMTSDGGKSSAYLLADWRWNQKNPKIKLWIRDDNNLKNEGLTTAKVKNAVVAATNAWEGASTQNLFADGSTGVEVSKTVNADKRDSKNVLAFTPFASSMSSALAYARTYYGTPKKNGKFSATESDICFNTGFNWWADTANPSGSKIDLQSVATHELGHSLGLLDLYGKSQFSGDTRQMMHYYTGVKRTLGNGDKTGIYTLYG